MKTSKILISLFIASTPLIFGGCKEAKDEPIVVTDLVYGKAFDKDQIFVPNAVNSERTTYSTIEKKITKKESFIVVVVGAQPCTCWDRFEETIKSYINQHNLAVYLITHNELSKNDRDTFGINYSETKHNLAIINKGKVVAQHLTEDGSDFDGGFVNWMDARIGKKPSMLYVSKKQLDSLYSNTKLTDFTIYFAQSNCGDCSKFTYDVLTPYLESKTFTDFGYIIDCDIEGIHFKNGEYDKTNQECVDQWNAFKHDYGLASYQGNEAGYSTGYVPTLYNIRPNTNGDKVGSVIAAGMVFYNDTYIKQQDDSFKITQSFYTSDRLNTDELAYLRSSNVETKVLENITYQKNETGINDYLYYQEQMFSYHKDIAVSFLDNYLF